MTNKRFKSSIISSSFSLDDLLPLYIDFLVIFLMQAIPRKMIQALTLMNVLKMREEKKEN